ncbi:hypothetical protein GLOTRDRAFT_127188 [Gloeophyllum trabeum ATCC 11539]|uniref:Uncharacterized protein n=1 Tax=Gloeophyllum trabeum (strain ATCC 11539 / FP-39264 / Madison 617) TaxID=670483 RepID=S7QHH1_GLOTA|nr:uncharacterized protein GLOTRDRAFT_127188 [Gloeophyllum trabeum ATCC 11539]EPQ58698.1 hypothetical protein GLOTRDRAFT_127188 [Gloeophyllum trabeum ATCC 11539]
MVDAAGNRGRVTQLMTVDQTDDASCLSWPSTVPHTTTTRNGAHPPSGSPSVTRPGPNRSSSSSRSSTTSSPSSSLSTKPTSLSSGQIAGIAIGSSIAASLLIVCTVAFVAWQAYRCGREAPGNNVVVVQNKEDGKSKPPPKQDEEAVITMPVLPPKDNPPRNANLVYIPNKGAMGVRPPSVRSLKHPVPKPPTPMSNPAPMPHTLPPPKAVNVAHKRRRVREGIVRQHVDHNRYMHTRPAGPAPYPPRMPNGGHPHGPLGLEIPPPGEEAANVRGRGVSASMDERYPYPAPVPGPGVMRNERYQRAGQVPDGPPPLVPRAPAGSQGFERPPPNRQRMAGGAARVDPRHLRPNPFPPR